MNEKKRTNAAHGDQKSRRFAAQFRVNFMLLFIMVLLASCNAAPEIIPTATFPPIILPQTPTPSSRCNTVNMQPTPENQENSLFPPVDENDPMRGDENGSVTLLVYGDFQDQPTAAFMETLWQLLEKYPEGVRVVYRDYPLVANPGHENAAFAAHAAHAAGLQGKYWAMSDLLFEKQEEWSPLSPAEFDQWLTKEAESLDVDVEKFDEDRLSDEIVDRVREAFYFGQEIGIPGTPFLLINGQIHLGPVDFANLDRIVALLLLGEKQFDNCPSWVLNPEREYLAKLHTKKGDVVIQLFPNEAPIAVNNFVFLAEKGWYKNMPIYRVVPDAYLETGDPSGTGQGNPGYFFPNEISPSLSFDRPGRVAMKNIGANTNGSQFFITFTAAPAYDGKYTIFGQVLKGMDILEELAAREPYADDPLLEAERIVDVTIEEP